MNRQPERRRHPRVSPKGTVIVRAVSHTLTGRLANVSIDGIAVTTRTTAPERLLGARAEISLRLDSGNSRWISLVGDIRRIRANTVGIALVSAPVEYVEQIDAISSASYDNARVLSVVLVDATEVRRHAIAEGFRAAGCDVLEVSSPLEAIVRLGESSFEPDLIAIADSLPASISDELRTFVRTDHPHTRLLTVGNEVTSPQGLARWLSAANPEDDLALRIRRLLI